VVVDDFDFERIVLSPDKANPPPVVDSNRVLTTPIALQRFEAVRRRYAQVLKAPRIVQEAQFPQRDNLNVRGSLRLRRPAQIAAVSSSWKLTITRDDIPHNVMRAISVDHLLGAAEQERRHTRTEHRRPS
jgi:hypothetical protein